MKLIKELLLDLSDPQKSLAGPLLKTKILVRKLDNVNINTWLDNELKGYHNKDFLPDYRVCRGVLKATYVTGTGITGFKQVTNQVLDLPMVSADERDKILSMNQTDGIATLETFVVNGSKGVLMKQLDGETCNWISMLHRKYGDPTFSVIGANVVVSPSVVQVALDYVRNTLFDFIIELEREYGEFDIDDLVKTENPKIDTIAGQTIIHQYGPAPIASVGDNTSIRSNIIVSKGNKDELRKILIGNKINDNEVNELLAVIDSETVNHGKFGVGVSNWIAKMIGKSASGGWEIGIGAAGSLLAQAISKYYGL